MPLASEDECAAQKDEEAVVCAAEHGLQISVERRQDWVVGQIRLEVLIVVMLAGSAHSGQARRACIRMATG